MCESAAKLLMMIVTHLHELTFKGTFCANSAPLMFGF